MSVRLFLAGDVMTGRGVDQILAHPSPPELYEPHVRFADQYVERAEAVNGPIPRHAAPDYVWGDGLAVLERRRPDARIVNLETSVTTSEAALPKGINYRMHPENAEVLTAAEIDCCVLANNHVLDWDVAGLLETLETLERAGVQVAGAGREAAAADAPATLPAGGGARVLVFGFCAGDSGVPPDWTAGRRTPGVNRLLDLSDTTVEGIGERVAALKGENDLVVASIHWGSNWGYEIPRAHRRFGRALVDGAGVDAVHGHSAHHPKAVEVYRGRPILYGCGDLINDYEGISGHEDVRGDLAVMYFLTFELPGGTLRELDLVPMRVRNFRLQHPAEADRDWLHRRLRRECERFGHDVELREEGYSLEW